MRGATQRLGAVALACLLVLQLALVVGCGRSTTEVTTSPNSPLIAGAHSTSHSVSVSNFAFSPASLTITQGDSVTWISGEQFISHTVTSDAGAPDSFDAPLGPQATFTFQFTLVGTYNYHCKIHPSMHGTIVVEAPATPPTATATANPTATATPEPTTTSTSTMAPTVVPSPTPTNQPDGK